MKVCKKCGELKSLSNYPKSKTCKDGHRHSCILCKNKQTMSYYYQNKERHREVADAWMKANPEKIKEIKKRWKIKNPLQVKVDNSKRQAILRSQEILWDKELTDFIFEEAHALRLLRNEATNFNWHVDHIIPLQGKLVCGLHVWNNFAVIPASVNLRKTNKYAFSEEWCPPI